MPKVAREFRGMWIATVANIDFPSAPNLTVEQQKAEIVNLLNLAGELKMNAVVFQVRPMGDALYQSEIEPSSWFLTNQMGKKLEFDPLKFAIDESHARGILLHAWFNPYRVSHASMKGDVAENHITKLRPDLVRTYNKGQILDPAEKDTQDYVAKVVLDVVKRYDLDGVHFDDYFYPYKDANQADFPDDETYKKYKSSGGKLGRDDWRRKNVDDFIQNISLEIKKLKPTVMFGISPFGIWKPNDIDIKGTSAYDTLTPIRAMVTRRLG
ncbi:MAG: family 10 glycosylhydrolase [Blastocatellia bacterium]|nr:family 10 glycosylhydrolase [Blastocatellia bacterium]